MGQQVTGSAAVDAHDRLVGLHALHLGSPGRRPSTRRERIRRHVTSLPPYTRPVRVVAGSLRGRQVVAPPGMATRPTTDRTREATFNALVSLGAVEGARVVDLFAGSGALGIEALSRGAASCRFIERDRKALESIRTNIEHLGLSDRATVLAADVVTSVVALRGIDLVLADPPYDYDGWGRLLELLGPVLSPDGVVVAESGREIRPPAGWRVVRAKRYGRAWVTFLVLDAPDDGTHGAGRVGTVDPA